MTVTRCRKPGLACGVYMLRNYGVLNRNLCPKNNSAAYFTGIPPGSVVPRLIVICRLYLVNAGELSILPKEICRSSERRISCNLCEPLSSYLTANPYRNVLSWQWPLAHFHELQRKRRANRKNGWKEMRMWQVNSVCVCSQATRDLTIWVLY